MSHLAASLRVVAHLIAPFMMETSKAVLSQLGLPQAASLENLAIDQLPAGLTVVEKGTPIFPRLDMEAEVDYIKGQMEGNKPAVEKEWKPEEVELKLNREAIKFDGFDKVEIRVAEVKEVSKVEGSDSFFNSVWMQVTVRHDKSSLVLLNTIPTSKNWSVKKSKS